MVRAADSDNFLIQHTDFSLREQVNYPNGGISRFYDNGIDMVIIDENICDHNPDEPVFSYMLITDKQNSYIHQFKRVFRFLGYIQSEVDSYLANDEMTLPEDYRITVGDRAEQADASPLEIHFEDSFSNAYGMNALRYLTREYGISDENGNNYFLDYFIRTQTERYAVEENGLNFHHPQIIGEEKYRKQLNKQNTCVLWGIKLFRFSKEDCAFQNRIEDDIKQYFGKDTTAFVDDGLKIDRKVELYEHQTISLQEIQKRRMAGIKAFLIVLPTASGKSRIVEEDLREFAKEKPGFRGLILVPGINILADWRARVQESVPELAEKIEIRTYAYMCRHYTEFPADYYNYIVVDEAHHAVAPMLKRVIQYYEADFTVGLTATDQRPDKKKLETVFGTYSTSLSLKEAMEKGIVARANVYRIISVYLTNIINLSLVVWIIQRFQNSCFKEMNSYFDALYYTIITFSTVGYGDIVPQTVYAKIVSIIIIASNFLLLLAFVNLFVMKAKKKEDYLNVVMYQISFLFEEMSSCCGTIDKSNKEKSLCWSEWVDTYIKLLNSIAENNPEKVKETEEKRIAIREHNSKCSSDDEMQKIPYYFINGKDQLLIERFTYSCKKVINAIEFLENNRINLLENENLTQDQFFVLSEIKDGFKVAGNHYRYGIKEGNGMMQAFKKDLYRDLERLGYQRYNLARFQGYGISNNYELTFALMRIDITDKKEIFWYKVSGVLNKILKI